MSTEIKNHLLTDDVNGSGAGRAIRPPAKQVGARLSKNFKVFAVIVLALAVAGILIGVMTSGNVPDANPKENTAQVAMAGMTSPDVAALQKAAVKAAEDRAKALAQQAAGNAGNGEGQGVAPQVGAGMGLNPSQGAAAAATNTPNNQPTPAQAHARWLEEQRFKAIEASVSAGQTAKNSIITVGGLSKRAVPSSEGASSAATSLAGLDELRSRLAAQAQSANASTQRLLALANNGVEGANAGAGLPPPSGALPQAGNADFLNRAEATKQGAGYLLEPLNQPLSTTSLFAGSVIPAVMLTGINSELPGDVSATVRQTIKDSRNERICLISQGTRIVGVYNSGVQFGQQRVMVAWRYLIYPDGRMIDIKGMQGADSIGQDGLNDQVDNHYLRTFGSAIMISLLGVGAQISQPQNSSALTAPSVSSQATGAAAAQLNSVGTNLLNKNLGIAPTLIIRPGFAFNVMVNKTMILPPVPCPVNE